MTKRKLDEYSIGMNIKRIREKAGLSKLMLQKKGAISRQTLLRIEEYGDIPSMRTLMRIAEALGVSTEKLLYG